MKFLSALFFIICLNLSLNAQNPKWFSAVSRIFPMQTMKQEIVNLFGEPKEEFVNLSEYETADVYITVEYATGNCYPLRSVYLAPKDTVIEMDFRLKSDFDFSRLKIDRSRLSKEKAADSPNTLYKNAELGITFDTFIQTYDVNKVRKTRELLKVVSIYPTENYNGSVCVKPK